MPISYLRRENGEEKKELIHHYDSAGVLQGMHNLDDSIASFARCCFNYALDTKQSICGLAAKILFPRFMTDALKKFLQQSMKMNSKRNLKQQESTYFYSLIDDIVARVMKAEGRIYLGMQEL